jgi:CO/xanthine dehydrogenase FAD-binding subunit
VAIKKKRVHVAAPGDLTDLLWMLAQRPESYLVAGGTDLMRRRPVEGFPEYVIDLTAAAELARMSRTERWLDLGATLPLSRLLSVARNVLPRVLRSAVAGIGGPALRNQATIGGNLCLASPTSDTLAPLFALDARVELRSSDGARWLPIQLFLAACANPARRPAEVITRVRVPLGEWDYAAFRKVAPKAPPSQSILSFCGLARLQREVLTDVRFAVAGLFVRERGSPIVFRDRALEVALTGQHLPLSRRLIEQLADRFYAALQRMPDARPPGSYEVGTGARLCSWFLDQVNHLHPAG